jgi:hypothetical protein
MLENVGKGARLKSRAEIKEDISIITADKPVDRRSAMRTYWGALKIVLEDLTITDAELAFVIQKQHDLNLSVSEIRCLHAKAFANVIRQCVKDQKFDDRECKILRNLHNCLAKLGWAPGE